MLPSKKFMYNLKEVVFDHYTETYWNHVSYVIPKEIKKEVFDIPRENFAEEKLRIFIKKILDKSNYNERDSFEIISYDPTIFAPIKVKYSAKWLKKFATSGTKKLEVCTEEHLALFYAAWISAKGWGEFFKYSLSEYNERWQKEFLVFQNENKELFRIITLATGHMIGSGLSNCSPEHFLGRTPLFVYNRV